MAFSIGSQNKPAFGTTTTTSSTGFGGFTGFGSTAATTQAGSLFGTTTTTSASTGFGATTGFGGTGTQAGSTGFTFGAPTSSTATGFGGFGSTATTQTGSTGFSFGTATTTSASTGFSFGGGFGGVAATTTSSTGFTFGTAGATSTAGGVFGGQNNAAANQSNTAAVQLANTATAVTVPIIFGDERDTIITKWNQLEAFWGTGRGYFSQQGSVDFTPDNPFCKFKAVAYSCLPDRDNTDGLIAVIFNKKVDDISQKQQEVVDTLQRICIEAIQKLPGYKPTISVCVESLTPASTDKCQMLMYLQERSPSGVIRRIPASQTFGLMNQTTVQQALSSQLSVSKLTPCMGFSKEELKAYLDCPPSGIDPLLWQQAKLENPDPERLLPVSMLGFSALNHRLQQQQHQAQLHQLKLDQISEDITLLKQRRADTQAKIAEYKKRQMDLGHRVLKVLVGQEISRKQGYAIQADEEQLRVHLEALQLQLNAPTQLKGRLNELMSQLRMQNQLGLSKSDASYKMNSSAQMVIRQHLQHQQEGIQHLINIVKDDLEDLKLIEQSLTKSP